jgi:hypothetical protein
MSAIVTNAENAPKEEADGAIMGSSLLGGPAEGQDQFIAAVVYLYHRIAPAAPADALFMQNATKNLCELTSSFVVTNTDVEKQKQGVSKNIKLGTISGTQAKICEYIDMLPAAPKTIDPLKGQKAPPVPAAGETTPENLGGGGLFGFGEETYRDVIGLSGNTEATSDSVLPAHYVFLIFHAICHFGAGSNTNSDPFYNSMDNIYKSFARKGYRMVVHPDFVHQAKDAKAKFADGKRLRDHDTFNTKYVSLQAKSWINKEEPSGETGLARPQPINPPSSVPPAEPAGRGPGGGGQMGTATLQPLPINDPVKQEDKVLPKAKPPSASEAASVARIKGWIGPAGVE